MIKKQINSLMPLVFLFSHVAFTQNIDLLKAGTRRTDLDVVNDFLAENPSDSLWEELLDAAPLFGNYCALEVETFDFDAPCLNKLDCMCKARHLATGIAKYRSKNESFLKDELELDLVQNTDPNWDNFLSQITVKLFAAKVVGVDISEGIRSIISLYNKDRKQALRKSHQIIDENEVFRRKIEEIIVEKLRFEEQGTEGGDKPILPKKSMSVSIQPFNLIFGLFLLNWENRISDIFSFRLGASVYATGLITDTYLGYGNNNKDFSTFLNVGLKSFIQGKTMSSGLYLEPNVEVGYENVARVSDPSIRDRDIAFVPGILFGLEKVFSSGFQIDLGVGGGFHLGIPVSEQAFSTNFVVPKLRAALGFAW